MSIRSFIAIDLPDALRKDVASLRRRLGLDRAPLKWVEERNLHLTMKFLGDVDEAAIPALLARVRAACAGEPDFEIGLSGVGTFPPGRPPRVLWVGVTENAEIVKRLAARIDKDLVAIGIEPELEGKEFHPHVTLARVRDGAPKGAVPSDFRGTGIGDVGRAHVTALSLKESRLSSAGPVYTTIGDAPLRSAS